MSSNLIGQKVPDFTLPATENKLINLTQLAGKKLVIYFYPKDSTPGCTTEGQNFRDAIAQFTAKNALILGVSCDSIKSHENFKCKQNFPFDLISDEQQELCHFFDVYKLKKLYGKEYMGIERSTFIVDEQGVIQKEWRKVKVANHITEVLEAL